MRHPVSRATRTALLGIACLGAAAAPSDAGDPHLVTSTSDSGIGSLRAAIEAAAVSGNDIRFSFSISVPSPHVIRLLTPLPPEGTPGATRA